MSRVPFISQLKSLFKLCTGDVAGAGAVQKEFLDAWEHHPLQQIDEITDGIPVVGHIKGIVHLAMGDTEAAIRSEEAATRTLVVMGAGALTVATGGAGAPILAGALAAVAAGAVYDGITTGIESARHHTYDPQGVFGAGTELVEEIHEGKDIRDGVFDTVSIVIGDALMGRTEGLGMTTKVFRVEGESFWKENGTYETRTSQRLFVIDGDIRATDAPSTAFVGPGQEDGNMLFLNFGEEARAHSYYAQRVLQYKDSVEAHTENLRTTEGGDIHPAVAPHNIRIKSFRILTRDAKDLQSRSVPEKWSRFNDANVGIIEVDPTKAPNQYGCTRAQYTPILQNALKGSYKDSIPWFRHLPPRVYELIQKHPIAYGRVRMIILDSKTVVVQALRAEIAQNIKDEQDEKTIRSSFVPLAYVKDDYVEKLDTLDVAIPGLRQCRHVKCGRKSSRDPDHGQHYEYLVDFGNNTTRWYPEELISDDLKEEYRQLTLSHAKHVLKVTDTSGDNLVVTHPDGSTETVPKTLMFWLEEPQEDTQMTVKEFDTILHHAHHGNDIATVGGTIAIRNMNGKYMKVTKTNGLEFNGTEFDDAAIFLVIPRSNGKIGLVGHNDKFLNMYYVDDVKCEGPGGGLDLSVTRLQDYVVKFGISGFQGQNGKTYYLSSDPGHESYNGSLAVKKEEDKTCYFTIENIRKASLTETVALKDMDGRFMSVTDSNGLSFNKTIIDENALFDAHSVGDKYALRGNNGKYVNMYYVDDVKCEGPGGGLALGIYNRPFGRVNLTISGYSSQGGATYFLSNKSGNAAYNGSLAVEKNESEQCRFHIERIIKTNVTGVITMRNLSGCYVKVTATGGLDCTSTTVDDNAKFLVKRTGSKLALIGNNGMYVNMYYVDDVKCEGPNGGLAVGLGYTRDGTIFFTISGYGGQGGATYFLSSEPGNAAYNGSLAVKRVGDDTCRFIVDSVANFSGTVSLKDFQGAYLRITDNNGLGFSHGAVDDKCKFTVKASSNKVNLIGNNGQYVNMYGISYVQCKGPSGGLAMGVDYLVNGLVRLTISGYQGQDGRTAYMSNRSGEANESLLVADEADASCRFVVENY